ncbi:CG9363 [Drosophila busckii]|uniref:maleylacetoacetate isomerase n=2 Tax=Drosophila busckii TaxID=30019 RepID=A0A0M5J2F7_DROBS|nr:CG9363 [Drosophila busckii]
MSSSAAAKPVLYAMYASSCSWRVRIALNLKQIPYDIQSISLLKPVPDTVFSNTDEYRKVNPMQQVPALHIDGHTLCDSVAIMHYLDETRPSNPLLPHDALQRAKVREIVQIICSGIQPLQNAAVLTQIGKEKYLPWAQQWISRGFRGLEQVLASSAGKYSVGDAFTMADCCLVPQVFNARRYEVDLEPYPNIVRLERELSAVPAISAGHPLRQPDCPPELASK